MAFVIVTVDVPDQERKYYAGPKRIVVGPRAAYKVTHVLAHATRFDTEAEAEVLLDGLDDGYQIVEVAE